MEAASTLSREEDTKNYIKYSAQEDSEIAEFSSVYIPKDEIDNPENVEVTVSMTDE